MKKKMKLPVLRLNKEVVSNMVRGGEPTQTVAYTNCDTCRYNSVPTYCPPMITRDCDTLLRCPSVVNC